MRRVSKRAAAVAAGRARCIPGGARLAKRSQPRQAEYGPTPFEVSAYGCIVGQGGNRTVPPGSTTVIRQGFSEQTLGILQSFLGAEITSVSVNDAAMIDVSESWDAPALLGGSWLAEMRYPTGVTLQPGQSMRFTFALLLKKSVPEVFNPAPGGPAGQPALNAAGLQFGGTCTVTVSS